jgi:gamma-glutamyltranspeptidase / glutathione hydrolase
VAAPRPLGAHRNAALGTEGAVTSSHPAVSQLGARILADGGNAFDATVAMAALSWLVLPGQCGIGGDAFVLVREADGRVWTLAGSGCGPDGGTSGFYQDRGLAQLPLSGVLSASVPGAIGTLRRLGERATRSLADLWQPAIRAAEAGVPCTAKTLADVSEHAASLAADRGTASVYLPGGSLPRVGDLIRQPELAATLRRLADDPAGFHTGWFADRALGWLAEQGAPFSGDEWALAADVPEEPAISTTYGGLLLHQVPQPSPGWMVLHQARVLDGRLAELDQLGAEAIHWFAGAAAASFRHRLECCGADNDNWRAALGDDAVRLVRQGIERREQAAMPGPAGQGDTTTTVCVDAGGVAISFIHSLAFTFGARVTVPGTGVVLNNRLGRGAYLIAGHPNEVRPRRRPLSTLNAWLLSDGDGLVALGNCPGGDGQVQWNMQVISHLVDHGDDPQRAVSMPRVTVFPGSDANTLGARQRLRCEEGIDPAALDRLEAWGHRVERIPAQRGGPGGSALVVTMDRERQVLAAAADPRMDGVPLVL